MLREAIELRLEAASSDYRDYQDAISAARSVLLIVAISYASLGLVSYTLDLRNTFRLPDDPIHLPLVEKLGLALVYGLLWGLARRRPAAAMFVAIALWLAHGVLNLMFHLVGFLQLWIDAIVTLLLVRGGFAAARAERFRRNLTARQSTVYSTNLRSDHK